MSFDFPKNWKQVVLEDALDALIDYRGKTPKKVDKGIPLITAKVVKSGRILPMDEFIADEDYESWMVRGIPQISDIVVTTEAPLGEVAQIKNANVALAQRIVTLRGKVDFLENDFLLFLMQSDFVQNQLEARATGSTVKGIKQSELRKIILPIPPIVEQKCIGKILSDLDDKIHLNNQINQTLESIAQAIFKSWFIDFDPVRAKITAKREGKDTELAAMCAISGKSEVEIQQMSDDDFTELQATAALFPDELVESELGEVPKGWELQSLYDTAEFVNGAAFKAKDFSSNTNEGLPIIKIAELKQGLSAQTKYTNLSFDQKYRVRSGDIFYSWSGSPETSLDVFKWFGRDGWLNQHIFKINTESKGKTYFVYYLLKYLKPTLIRLATNKQTTGLGHITVADMKSLQVIKPEEHLFLRYAKIVAPFYEKESLLKQEIINLAMLRDTLLPKLLSGEVSLGDVIDA